MKRGAHVVAFAIWGGGLICAFSPAGIIDYSYDTRQQLTGVSYSSNYTVSLAYDAAGNIERQNAVTDSDGDQLPDEWEMANVGDLDQLSAAGDRDGDGMTDLQEYLGGFNAVSNRSCFMATGEMLAGADGVLVVWPSETNRLYRIERSTNLLNGVFVALQDEIPGTPPINQYRDATATNTGPWYYRIHLAVDP